MKKSSLLFLFLLIIQPDIYSQIVSGTVKEAITSATLENAKIIIINYTAGTVDSVFTNNIGRWSYSLPTSVNNEVGPPDNFFVMQNFPNPFNPSTKIQFIINSDENVEISIHNILGELVDYREQYLRAGTYSIEWQSKGAAGVYLYTIRAGENSITKKMIQLDGGFSLGGLRSFNEVPGSKTFSKNKAQSQNLKIIYSKNSHLSDSSEVEVSGGENLLIELSSYHSLFTMIDLHNDVLEIMVSDTSYHLKDRHSYNHTDIPRLQEGSVDILFFSAWVSPSQFTNYFQQVNVMLDRFEYELNDNPDDLGQALTYDEAIALNNQGKIAGVIGVEGGHVIEDSMEKLDSLYNRGMRYLTITWNNSTNWAISASDPLSETQGLTEFGRDVIRRMDSLGVIIDVSHTGIKTIQDILEETNNPIVATHSGVRALKNHTRNLYDWQIEDIASSGGVIGVVFYPPFLTTASDAYIEDVVEHIDYIKNLVGVDYAAIGSDFDGIGNNTVIGLENVSKFPRLTEALFDYGYSKEDVEKILGGNFKRVFEQVCGISSNKKITKLKN
jgi:membrane dipeptidase